MATYLTVSTLFSLRAVKKQANLEESFSYDLAHAAEPVNSHGVLIQFRYGCLQRRQPWTGRRGNLLDPQRHELETAQ